MEKRLTILEHEKGATVPLREEKKLWSLEEQAPFSSMINVQPHHWEGRKGAVAPLRVISIGEGTILEHGKGAVVPLRWKKRCSRTVDRPPIHRSAWLAIKNMRRKSGFQVLENPSPMRTVLFGLATYFLFLFLKWEKLSKNKNPLMTLVKKKRSAKLDFWVQGSGYLLGRYVMRGSTPLGLGFSLY